MGLWQKILNFVKVKQDNDTFYYKIEQKTDDDRRQNRRVPFPANFCVFVPGENEEIDPQTTPITYGSLNNINLTGAAFRIESRIACSPYHPETEREIRPHMTITFVFSAASDSPCGAKCSVERADERKSEIIKMLEEEETTAAQVVWVKDDSFGCQFINPTENLINAVYKMIRLWEDTEKAKKEADIS